MPMPSRMKTEAGKGRSFLASNGVDWHFERAWAVKALYHNHEHYKRPCVIVFDSNITVNTNNSQQIDRLVRWVTVHTLNVTTVRGLLNAFHIPIHLCEENNT